jgi:DNA-binding response OmpR family regulator
MTKILLVEDNEMNQDMLTRRLLRRGYEVVCAMDGQTGVSMASSEQPDLILMDMSLPIMDGWAATRVLKADPKTRSIPIIALTAHAMVGDRQKSMDAGCDDYDTKPVELARLLSKVETLLASSKIETKVEDRSIVEADSEVIAVSQKVISLPNIVRSIDPTAATILIIDDIETNRDMLGRRLERAGYTVILAEGGRQGIELIDRQPIDLVLLDIMMPDFNGIETLKSIRTKYSMAQLPVIMATAKDRSEDMLQAFDLGANDYVTKPIDLPIVLARIQSHLRLIQSARQEPAIPSTSFTSTIQSIPADPRVNLEPVNIDIDDQPLSGIFEPNTLEPASRLLLGRYKISQKLADGDFQQTYLAQDTKQSQEPTCLVQQIKLNRDRPSLSVATIHQFKREIEIFNQLAQHRNIAKIFDAFQQEQQICIVQEYIGTDLLANKLKLERSVGIASALTMIVEMLEILQHLHQYQIVHQHLDANCFAYCQEGKLVLVDLGIATRLSAKLYQPNQYNSNIYQMPTQWQSSNIVDLDIYPVGMIVLHALTGIAPNLLPIDPLTGEMSWRDSCIVAESFASILSKMISKNSVNRYNSIELILNDLYQLPMVSILLNRSRTLV